MLKKVSLWLILLLCNFNLFAQYVQIDKLFDPQSTGVMMQGTSVSLTPDGKTAIVGADFDRSGTGGAWIYTYNGKNFTQFGNKLVGGGAWGSSYFGRSVSLSADGKTALVGGLYDNNSQGAAWVYTYNGSSFIQVGNKLVDGSAWTPLLGSAVSLSSDGKIAMVGGPGDVSGKGAVWVYTFNGTSFVQAGNKLAASDGFVSFFGSSISLSQDGNTALIGGYGDNGYYGAVWIFTFNGTNFVQAGNKLVATGNAGTAYLGHSVSLSADGKTALVGGSEDNAQVGAAWVFTFNGTGYVQAGSKLIGSGAVGNARQGFSVSLSADGKTAMIGGLADNSGVGATWIYTFNGTNFVQSGSKIVGAGSQGNANQGISVSISANGKAGLAGGNRDNASIGAVWVFQSLLSQTIVGFNPFGIQQYSQSTYTITGVSATSGLPVIFTSSNPSVATISGNVISFLSVGVTTITAYQQRDSSFSDANPVAQVLRITAPPSSITFNGFTAKVGDNINLSDLVTSNSSGPLSFTSSNSSKAVVVSVSNLVMLHEGILTITGTQGTGIDHEGSSMDIIVTITGVNASRLAQAGKKLAGQTYTTYAQQGTSVSISDDGKVAVVGAPGDLHLASRGYAIVYTFDGNNFVEIGSRLNGLSYDPQLQLGLSVSLSSDGKIILLGAYNKTLVYTFNGSNYDLTNDELMGIGTFGAVSLSGDGKTALIGFPEFDSNHGGAWVYTFNGTNYIQLGTTLIGTGSLGEAYQGRSVSLSKDGKIAFVGASGDNSSKGAVWVYSFNGNNFVQFGNKLVGTNAIGSSEQGKSVSLSSDGKVALVGGFSDDSFKGATWVYTFNGTSYIQLGNKLVGSETIGASFQGISVSISSDAKVALIGGHGDDVYTGAAWHYTFDGNNFIQTSKLKAADGIYNPGGVDFGVSVSLSANGKYGLVGGPSDNFYRGSAWVFADNLQDQTITGFPVLENSYSILTNPISFENTSATSGLPVEVISSSPNIISVSGNNLIFVGRGVTTITVSQMGNFSYGVAPALIYVVNVYRLNQNMGFPPIANITFSGPIQTVVFNATATSGLTVEYTINTIPNFITSLHQDTLKITGPGLVTVTAYQIGGIYYTAAAPIRQTFSIIDIRPVNTPTGNNTTPSGPVIPIASIPGINTLSGLTITATTSALFHWSEVQSTVGYCFEISQNASFNSLSYSICGITDTFYLLPNNTKVINGKYYWRVASVFTNGRGNWSNIGSFTFSSVSGIAGSFDGNEIFEIYPNPSSGTFTIKASSQNNEPAIIKVYNYLGQLITSLSAGDASLPEGLYLLRNGRICKKLIVE